MEAPIDADLLRIPVGPGSIHVERYGHGGPAVLLVHGFGTCSFLWRNVAPELALANRTAFSIDLFGYGESDRPFDADFGIAAQAEHLDHALTALRLARAAVVGIDLGGALAMRLAATRPEREAQAEYLDHARTALRLARAAVVGIDLGGAIAMRLAATRPERVEKLVLVNPIAFDGIPADDIKSV